MTPCKDELWGLTPSSSPAPWNWCDVCHHFKVGLGLYIFLQLQIFLLAHTGNPYWSVTARRESLPPALDFVNMQRWRLARCEANSRAAAELNKITTSFDCFLWKFVLNVSE